MFFRSNVFYQYFQFFICVFIGWFMVGIWNGQFQYNKDMMISEQCSCQRYFCMPCKKPEDTRITEMRNTEVANSYYRSYRYTPLSATEDEIGRWRFLTEKYNYEMINQEPRVGLNGMWKLEVNRVKTQGEKFINDHDSKNKLVTGRLKLDGMHHHIDPFSGVKYLITFEVVL
ncbi:uncharacterized protein LOC143466180 [Clavelina lepadiformis]|uniref:uncharacterized protein LOC143466180 n=1 Tax=Clavelina lepadiformis TaxID=159417 RepID=UPI0040415060